MPSGVPAAGKFCFRLVAEAARCRPAATATLKPAKKKTSRRGPPTEKSPSLLIASIHCGCFEHWAHHHDHRVDLHCRIRGGASEGAATLDDPDGLRRKCADPGRKSILRKVCDAIHIVYDAMP